MRGSDFKATPRPHPAWTEPVYHYWDSENRSPDCIIGMVLFLAGVKANVIETLDETGGVNVYGIMPASEGEIVFSDEARELLEIAQAVQDDDETWGAVEEYAASMHRDHLAARAGNYDYAFSG